MNDNIFPLPKDTSDNAFGRIYKNMSMTFSLNDDLGITLNQFSKSMQWAKFMAYVIWSAAYNFYHLSLNLRRNTLEKLAAENRAKDLELINLVASSVSIPVIAHGGPGKLSDISNAINNNADAVAISSMLHYDFIKKNISDGHTENEGNTEFLRSGKTFGKIQTANLTSIKTHLIKNNIATRQIDL